MINQFYADFAWEQAAQILAIDSPSGFTHNAAIWAKEAFAQLGYPARITTKGGVIADLGGPEGTEGLLLVDDVPEADAVCSGGSIERSITLPKVDRAVGGDTFRLNKESGGWFPPATEETTIGTCTHMYMGGNQCAYSKIMCVAY
jgi:hypothetical protein